MDSRVLPFAMPMTGSEQEEGIGVLSSLADDLLAAHHRRVSASRRRLERYSRIAFVVSLVALFIFLIQDFESAPIVFLLAAAIPAVGAALVGILFRTRLADAERFDRPEILRAVKLSWQWVALPINKEHLILWDTLTDEALALELPAPPPMRSGLFLRELDPIAALEEERQLIYGLSRHLNDWRRGGTPVRLPRVGDGQERIVQLLSTLPRGRGIEPAPLLTPARSLAQGRGDLVALLKLRHSHAALIRQMDAWQEALPAFVEDFKRALAETLPTLQAPPPPPHAHPSGDVEALRATVELVRATTIEELRVPLAEELSRQKEQLEARLAQLTEERERERSVVHYGNDTLINALQRQIEDMEKRVIPESEEAMRQSEIKLKESEGRVAKIEAELADKRKQLLLAGSGKVGSPRASDDRKRELSAAVDRLTGQLSEAKRGVTTWNDVVASHRGALERARRQLESLRKEHNDYTTQRHEQLEKVDRTFEERKARLREQFGPVTTSIEQDLAYFDTLVEKVSAALDPFRVDLVMDDESVRPYNQVVHQAQRILTSKQETIDRWATQINGLIDRRRAAVLDIVRRIDEVAIPNFGLRNPRIMLIPIWYVEVREGQAALWPWERRRPREQARFLAPFVRSPLGERVSLPGGDMTRMMPLDALQRRLDALLKGERGKEIQADARRLGRPISFDPKVLNEIALASQMPRSMVEMLKPLHHPDLHQPLDAPLPPGVASGLERLQALRPSRDGARLPAPVTIAPPELSDEFIPVEPGADDAWDDDGASAPTPDEEDAWEPEPVPEPEGHAGEEASAD